MSSILYNTHMRKVMYIVAINACVRDLYKGKLGILLCSIPICTISALTLLFQETNTFIAKEDKH